MDKKRTLMTAVSVVLALTFTVGATGCKKKKQNQAYDPETKPLTMGFSTPDEVFNPFFATSAYDTQVIGMTQIGMLSTDKSGKIVPTKLSDPDYLSADNEPCVVEYWDSRYDENATEGSKEYPNYVGVTTYQLAIKKGIKFSDGSDLTIKDVLFNLYAYLDPAYTGSSTVYSTHILGMNAYRTQLPDANDTYAQNIEAEAQKKATERQDKLVGFIEAFGFNTDTEHQYTPSNFQDMSERLELLSEYIDLGNERKKELESDWNVAVDSIESYKEWDGFGQAWVIYLKDYGGRDDLILKKPGTNTYVKDKDGNCEVDESVKREAIRDIMVYCSSHSLSTSWVTWQDNPKDLSNIPLDVEIPIDIQKEYCITMAFANSFGTEFDPTVTIPSGDITEEKWEELRVQSGLSSTRYKNIDNLFEYGYASAETMMSRYTAEGMSELIHQSGSVVRNISGIKVLKADNIFGQSIGEEHDILEVKIRGVDPKAIWNLAFTVSPYKYYSGTYQGKNYVEALDNADVYSENNAEFGVALGEFNFFQNVMNAPSKVGLPVGAGPYQASDANGNPTRDADRFFDGGFVYFQRNDYFNTTAKNIENAKIKYLWYKVVATDQVINSLVSGEILYGEPSASKDKIKQLQERSIAYEPVKTAGYGYVGINPRFVEDIHIRRAIISAMDTKGIFNDYYTPDIAESINRPMTKANWAYPENAPIYKPQGPLSNEPDYSYDPTGGKIDTLLGEAGYYKDSDGNWNTGSDLTFKFTIAGGSTDHPAYSMFIKAAKLLNDHGFNVKVVQSQTALSDLVTGKLEVWAAAWSSTVDPDMYQVYHKDSKATSVNNWGYPQILKNANNKYDYELRIVGELSNLIDRGRESEDQAVRKPIYAQALDKVMELAVEFPLYQRSDVFAYDNSVIDPASLTPHDDLGAYNGLFARIWEVNYL